MIISLANSIPLPDRFRSLKASLVMARKPQWASSIPDRKNKLRIPVKAGLPIYRFFQGIAPSAMPPLKRDPMHKSAPSANWPIIATPSVKL